MLICGIDRLLFYIRTLTTPSYRRYTLALPDVSYPNVQLARVRATFLSHLNDDCFMKPRATCRPECGDSEANRPSDIGGTNQFQDFIYSSFSIESVVAPPLGWIGGLIEWCFGVRPWSSSSITSASIIESDGSDSSFEQPASRLISSSFEELMKLRADS